MEERTANYHHNLFNNEASYGHGYGILKGRGEKRESQLNGTEWVQDNEFVLHQLL